MLISVLRCFESFSVLMLFNIAPQIGFGDYVAKMDDPSPAMTVDGKHACYDVEEQYAIVLERFKCHLTEDQGLVWTGLPAKSDIQWEPQTTIIKVTSTFATSFPSFDKYTV